ncbi:O-antigen ligase family protein [Paraburkholderia sp. UCT31]|uniref:O-antigen ligase family protein n=1 Tax=Paraburkholderia sp. UCT31 TaxID=2615209 RepID=UPI00165577F7|nr:O-antigen ligase family protein [Paraburkholderia sp. UCT31]MBC8738482.1 O-antigen ligase family protein [Paraburkholderia sp. UCT31]
MTLALQRWATPVLFAIFATLSLFAHEFHWELAVPTFLLAGAVAFSAIARGEVGGLRLRTPEVAWPALALLSILGLVLFVSPARWISLYEFQYQLLLFGGVLLFSHMRHDVVRRCLGMLLVPFMVFVALAIYQIGTAQGLPNGAFTDPNMFAGLILALSAVWLGISKGSESRLTRIVFGTCAVLGFVCVYFAMSRGAWVALTASILIAGFALRERLGVKVIVIVLAAAVSLGVGHVSTRHKTVTELAQHQGLGDSLNSRVAMWESSGKMIADHPLVGHGVGLWYRFYPRYRLVTDIDSAGYHAHNDYLEAAADGGLLGLFAILAVPGLAFFAIRRLRESASRTSPRVEAGLAVGTLVIAIQAVVNFVFHDMGMVTVSGVLLGSLIALSKPDEVSAPMSPPKQIAAALMMPVLAFFAASCYLGLVPSLVIGNPAGKEAKMFPWILDSQALLNIHKLSPFASDPYFVTAHIAHMQAALEKDPVKKKALLDRALFYYDKASALDATSPLLQFRKASVVGIYPGLPADERYTRSLGYLKAALDIDPSDFAALRGYTKLLMMHGKKAEALAAVQNAQDRKPTQWKNPMRNLRAEIEAGAVK